MDWQAKPRNAAASVRPIFQGERAAVGFGDLPAQDQTHAAAARFGGKKWDEKIGDVGKPGAIIDDLNLDMFRFGKPTDPRAAAGFGRCIHGIANQVD